MGYTVTLPAKIVGETIAVDVDFSGLLETGETVASAATTASVYSGTDATPSAIISGTTSVSQNIATQVVTAGTAGVIYLLRFTATTSTSNIRIILAKLAVITET